MITLEKLTKRFGRMTAVNDVSLALAPGDAVALWGPNGAGKSTIIRCMLGLFRYQGRITVGGLDAARQGKAARRLIGYVPQELGFYDDLRAGEAVRYFARLKGVDVGGRGCIAGILERVGLPGQEGKRMRDLSGGMKQRLALAIALLGEPPVLILDEVTASLDAAGREEFMALLSSLAGAGRTLLFASHRVEEIGSLATRVILLERGRVVAEHTPASFAQAQNTARIMRIRLDRMEFQPAMEALRGAGFAPTANCVGVLVPIAADRKADPLRILARAGIGFEDFDLVNSTQVISNTEGKS
jgi:ABC-type multidrug transport system ATPase subunit